MPKCQLGLFEVGRELPTCFPSSKWKAEKVPLCSLQASFCKAKHHTQEPIRHCCAVLPRCDWTWQGVTKKFEYKMRLVYAHFPINVNIINGGKVGPQWGLYDTIRVSENMIWQPNITFLYGNWSSSSGFGSTLLETNPSPPAWPRARRLRFVTSWVRRWCELCLSCSAWEAAGWWSYRSPLFSLNFPILSCWTPQVYTIFPYLSISFLHEIPRISWLFSVKSVFCRQEALPPRRAEVHMLPGATVDKSSSTKVGGWFHRNCRSMPASSEDIWGMWMIRRF